jgi:hypothetical protein
VRCECLQWQFEKQGGSQDDLGYFVRFCRTKYGKVSGNVVIYVLFGFCLSRLTGLCVLLNDCVFQYQ